MNSLPANLQARIPSSLQPYLAYLIPVVAAAIALIIIVVVLLPSVNDIVTLKADADSNQGRAQSLSGKISDLQNLDQAKLTDELVNTTQALPSDKDVAGFLANINQITSSTGASLEAAQLITTLSTKPSEKNALDFQVIIKGNFANIKGFLTKIETVRRVMVVKSLSINLSDNKVLVADMNITGYYEPQVTVVGLDDSLPKMTATQEKILTDLEKRTIYTPSVGTPSSSGRSDPFAGF